MPQAPAELEVIARTYELVLWTALGGMLLRATRDKQADLRKHRKSMLTVPPNRFQDAANRRAGGMLLRPSRDNRLISENTAKAC